MAKKTKTASMAPTRPRTKPPSSRPSDGVKGARKPKIKVASSVSTKPMSKPPSKKLRGSSKKKRDAKRGRLS